MGLHLNFKLRMDASTAASAAHAMLADLHKLANTHTRRSVVRSTFCAAAAKPNPVPLRRH